MVNYDLVCILINKYGVKVTSLILNRQMAVNN